MKYLIVSDIHGSIDSANIIKEKFLTLKCDKILLLGDILYHGPRNDLPNNYTPKQVINVLNSLKDYIIAVRGNCDAEVDQMVLDFKINQDYSLKYNSYNIYLTHGHHVNYLSPKSFEDKTIIIHGHTHIIRKDEVDNNTYVNIGSITLPKENTARCYAILENNSIVVYDINDKEVFKVIL